MKFNELDAVEAYDGIYACASLTHARRNELPSILAKIRAALVDGGVVWASFKTGAQEDEDSSVVTTTTCHPVNSHVLAG